jgi:hypothetical protein
MADLLPPSLGNVNDTIDRLSPPTFGAPQAPSFGGPPPVAPQPAVSIWKALAPVAAAFIAGGGRDPAAIGTGLAAFQRGRQMKQQQGEQEADRLRQQQIEQAEFYARMIEQSQAIDDPLVFEKWKQAITPVAQVHGLSTDALTFSDEKRKAKDTKTVQAALDAAVRLHGPEILNNDAVSVSLPDGRQVSMPTARGLIGGTVTQNGTAVPVKVKAEKDLDAPPDLSRSGLDVQLVDAKRRAARGEPGAAADVKLIEDTILKGDTLRRDPPRITVNAGTGNTTRADTRVDRVWTAFNSHPIVKEYNEVQAQQATIKSVVAGRWSGPGDMSVIFGFMKALDPNSVVRETEYDNASKSGNIFSGWAARFNGKLNPSGGFLSDQVKKDFLATITARLNVKKQQYDNLRKEMSKRIDGIRSGTPETGDESLIDYASAIPAEAAPPDSGVTGFTYQDYLKSRGGAK